MAGISFFKLNKMAATGKIQDIDSIKKIILSTTGCSAGEIIAVGIDIEEKTIYCNMDIIDMGKVEPTKIITDEEIFVIKKTLYDTSFWTWQDIYTDVEANDMADGYGWMLALEGPDRLVEKHCGSGTSKGKVVPAGYEMFEKVVEDILK